MSSNYESQLKAFGIDHAIKLGLPREDVESLIGDAKKIADFCYCAHEDVEKTSQHLYQLLQETSASVNIHNMIMALKNIREQRIGRGVHAAVTEQEKEMELV